MAGPAGHDVIPDLIGNLFKRNNRDGAGNGIVFLFCQMNDSLIGATAEMELRIAKFGFKRAIDESIYVWKNLT
jgi:hypothetical protein